MVCAKDYAVELDSAASSLGPLGPARGLIGFDFLPTCGFGGMSLPFSFHGQSWPLGTLNAVQAPVALGARRVAVHLGGFAEKGNERDGYAPWNLKPYELISFSFQEHPVQQKTCSDRSIGL